MAGRHALLIGISRYGEGLRPIPSALKDVEALREVLLDPELGGIPSDQLHVLTDPDRTGMEIAIESFYANKEPDDVLLLYFSGHGFRDEADRQLLLSTRQSCRVSVHGTTSVQIATALPASTVRRHMQRSRSSRQVVILDCCFSAAFAEGLAAKDAGALSLESLLGGKGKAVLTSSDIIETSRAPVSGDEPSLYTRFLVEGIQTGRADRLDRGWCDPEDLHHYAKARLREEHSDMNPQYFPIKEGGSIRICNVRRDISQTYRQKVRASLAKSDGAISEVLRETFDVLRLQLGLEEALAARIEEEEARPHRERQSRRERYRQALSRQLLAQGEGAGFLSAHVLGELQELAHLLNLSPAEVEAIHQQEGVPLGEGVERGEAAAFSSPSTLQGPSPAQAPRQPQALGSPLATSPPQPSEASLPSSSQAEGSASSIAPSTGPPPTAESAATQQRTPSQPQRQPNPPPAPSPKPAPAAPRGSALISIPTTRGWLERQGDQWRKTTERITVSGYREELAEGLEITMVRIPAGEFLMGSPATEAGRSENEGPQHRVKLQRFYLAQTPVTQAQWQVVAGWPRVEVDLKPAPSMFMGPNRPVETVNWNEAVEFCKRLSQRTARKYTLPSEAQWEYACRAGTTTPFHFGETLATEVANYDGDYSYQDGPKGEDRKTTLDVGSFPANAWGLQDMHGSVWEWCLDLHYRSYQGAPGDGTAWTSGWSLFKQRVQRGGSWCYGPLLCRSAHRTHPQLDIVKAWGFRVCCLPQDFVLYP
jgi:formylglycine-generating enzyme required for sulfatase activity